MILTEIKYRLFRNGSRTLLLILTAALLCSSMALYLGNIRQSEAALENMGEAVPVTVRVVSEDGSKSSGLAILNRFYDALSEGGVRDLRATATGAGILDQDLLRQTQETGEFTGGDVQIVGVNCLEAYPMKKMTYAYAEGESADCLTGSEAKCLIDGVFARELEIGLGDRLELPVYLYIPDIGYKKISDGPVTVAGTYTNQKGEESAVTMLLPVAWMRAEAEESGLGFFSYDSCSALVAEPLRLNEFKAKMTEADFLEPDGKAEPGSMGNALSVEDKLFIKTVGEVEKNLAAYRTFLIPFFGLVVILVTLVIFLSLRSARKDMAIAVSLGRSRPGAAASHFCGVLLADLLGCVIALPLMIFAAGLSVTTACLICGLFLLCGAVGTTAALALLLRFDAMELLAKVD